jgi:signal transduction histidine kinase
LKLKWKIFLILAIFALVVVALLWVFQIVFLDDFYRTVRTSRVRDITDTITANIDDSQIDVFIGTLAYREDVTIIVVDKNENIRYQVFASRSVLAHLTDESISAYYRYAYENDGSYYEFTKKNLLDTSIPHDDQEQGGSTETLIYSKIVRNANDEELCLILESETTPMAPTMRMSMALLIMISISVLLMAGATAFVLSRRVVKPIEKLTNDANAMTDGEFDIEFASSGFKEIADLSTALNYASKEISTVEHLRRELLSNVSHDLRTPLTLIKGYAEMMRDFQDELTSENMQVVIDETERLTYLVNDMLDLSRMQTSKTELHLTHFDIIKTLSGIVERHDAMLKPKGYSVEYEHSDESVPIYADELKITQVIYNLLSNAINYAGDDMLILVREYKKGKNVRIEIIDNGIGIDVDKIPHIWDRYYKSDKSHRRGIVGTGLGLSIVKSVMTLHLGGVYGVDSSRGNGSKFYIELPFETNKNDNKD